MQLFEGSILFIETNIYIEIKYNNNSRIIAMQIMALKCKRKQFSLHGFWKPLLASKK